jgi:predicted nuclease of predicted toxin-antitoxin system
MKVKLDENLPNGLAEVLRELGHDTQTTSEENLDGCAGSLLWEIVQREGRFLITQDMDFSDARKFSPGTHHGILLVRLREPSRANLLIRLQDIFQSEPVDQWRGCFVIATQRKVRIVRA